MLNRALKHRPWHVTCRRHNVDMRRALDRHVRYSASKKAISGKEAPRMASTPAAKLTAPPNRICIQLFSCCKRDQELRFQGRHIVCHVKANACSCAPPQPGPRLKHLLVAHPHHCFARRHVQIKCLVVACIALLLHHDFLVVRHGHDGASFR